MPKKIDLVNQRFGRLLVLERTSSSRSQSVLWRCLCDCGNEHLASTRHLNRNGRTGKFVVRSCGCLQTRSGKENPNWRGSGEISGHWWAAKVVHSAKGNKMRRQIPLEITKEYAWQLFKAQGGCCYFTGQELRICNNSSANTASLDRIDNELGYIEGNVRWVHKHINIMKNRYTDSYFVDLCRKVVEYQFLKPKVNGKDKNATGACPIR
jgi:hypothetical protein